MIDCSCTPSKVLINPKKLFSFPLWSSGGSFTSYIETYVNVYCISWMQSLCLSIHLCFQKQLLSEWHDWLLFIKYENAEWYLWCWTSLQFYTFLETTLVTVSLLPIFIALFTDDEIPESPGNLAASFITFGKFQNRTFFSSTVLLLLLHYHNFWYLLFAVLNLAFALSILGFLIMHISLVAGNTTTIEVML